jgi:hypothetical protein
MSRVAQVLKSKIVLISTIAIIIIAGVSIGIYAHDINSGQVQLTANSQHQLTEISYDGKNGENAYTLLKKYADVQAKHYSFGYFVTSINGVPGNGPKYWTFFVNGKESSVGASSYTTKSSDKISWKLE